MQTVEDTKYFIYYIFDYILYKQYFIHFIFDYLLYKQYFIYYIFDYILLFSIIKLFCYPGVLQIEI